MKWNKCPNFYKFTPQIPLQRGICLIVAGKLDWKYSSQHVISISTIDLWKYPAPVASISLKEVGSFFPLNVQIDYAPESLPGVLVAIARSQKIHFNRRGIPEIAWLETKLHLCTWFQVPLLQKLGRTSEYLCCTLTASPGKYTLLKLIYKEFWPFHIR